MTKELKPCPFCNKKHLEYNRKLNLLGKLIFFVDCINCTARGGWGFTTQEAIESWNRRADD